ncbi:MAG: outer membrane protein-like protein [Segetibacter sp.]|nr:outer membrane protein-like protein [Segetibacter sp.]
MQSIKILIMKKIMMPLCLMAFLSLGVGCNSNKSSETSSSDSSTMMNTSTDTSTTSSSTTAPTTSGQDTSMGADRDFVMDAASGGLMEVELGKLAQANAASAQVKEFGKMMVTDHSKANTELKGVASTKNITVPATPMEKQQKHIDDLKTKKGADFDKAYVDMMVDDHKEDISKFEDEANKGHDADVKAFAAKTLPVLNKHLEHIKKIQDAMKK